MHRAWESNETRTHSALSHNNNGISCTYKQTLYLCVCVGGGGGGGGGRALGLGMIL